MINYQLAPYVKKINLTLYFAFIYSRYDRKTVKTRFKIQRLFVSP